MSTERSARVVPTSNLGWFYLTPDRIANLLLAFEGVLWFLERFRWIGYFSHKGWPVLIAVATVGAVILAVMLGLLLATIFPFRFQFSLRSLILLTLAVAIACSWLTAEVKRAKELDEIVALLQGGAMYDFDLSDVPGDGPMGTRTPSFLQRTLGESFFSDVLEVNIASSRMDPKLASGAVLARIKEFGRLTKLQLCEPAGSLGGGFGMSIVPGEKGPFDDPPDSCGEVTANDLANLEPLTELEVLHIYMQKTSGAGFEHLRNLKKLRVLRLDGVQITDRAVEHLREIPNLRELSLDHTPITDAGLKYLKGLTNLENLHLGNTKITDTGLQYLKGLSGLRYLDLHGVRITDRGLSHVKKIANLRTLILDGTPITDAGLEQLTELKQLETLSLWSTEVTGSGFACLQQMPALRYLDLCETKINDTSLDSIGKLTQLRSLSLMGNGISTESLRRLDNLKELECVSLDADSFADSVELQKKFPKIKVNSFRGFGAGPIEYPGKYYSLRPSIDGM